MSDLNQGTVPSHWMRYKIPKGTSVSMFINNLSKRLEQLEKLGSSIQTGQGVWLGGLFQPEAYITATRQTVAHQKGWSLEQLVLTVDLEATDLPESFKVDGMFTPSNETHQLTKT